MNISIGNWFIAGHSLGGQAAANYIYDHPSMDGLILMGAYLSSLYDFSSRTDMGLLVMVGSLEASGTPGTDDYGGYLLGKEYAPDNLPDNNVTYPIIEGGIHFGFCYQENPPQ